MMLLSDSLSFMTRQLSNIKQGKYCITKIRIEEKLLKMIRQNIHLFIERNEDDPRRIDSRLVKLYMNRFVINEEYQNEVIGVEYLAKIEKVELHRDLLLWSASLKNPSEFPDKFAFDIYAKWRRSQSLKLHKDIKIINAALQKWTSMTSVEDLHFIIGSSYYMSIYARNFLKEPIPVFHFSDPNECRVCEGESTDERHFHEPPLPMEKLLMYIIAKSSMLNFGIDFACTFISGLNFCFCTKSQFEKAFYSEAAIESQPAISSVSNDSEQFYKFMMITDKWEKLKRKFSANQYKELFAIQLIEDKEQFTSLEVGTLDKLYFGHSNSVAVNPEIMEEDTSFQIKSKRLDRHCQELRSSEYFLPPIRSPVRQDLKP